MLSLLAGLAAGVALACLIAPAMWVYWRTDAARYSSAAAVPAADVALVFGAGLTADGSPSPLLADRIHAAVLLYRAGKVQRILLSGDGSSPGHDEPGAMARQAEAEGVPAAAVLRDPLGLHTRDTCRRARTVFGVHSVVAVSQSYHLPRAIFTCRAAGLQTTGFSFARVPYAGSPAIRVRELLSLDAAWWEALGP
ncbi:MAG: SanA/YdcF family protein [Dehalococcoidia bacterium]